VSGSLVPIQWESETKGENEKEGVKQRGGKLESLQVLGRQHQSIQGKALCDGGGPVTTCFIGRGKGRLIKKVHQKTVLHIKKKIEVDYALYYRAMVVGGVKGGLPYA